VLRDGNELIINVKLGSKKIWWITNF
jgi:hypothetical protein